MIGEVCRFYGWTVEYCLGMPCRRFSAMVDAMRKLDAYEKMEACDIAAITMLNSKWFEKVRGRYERQANPEDTEQALQLVNEATTPTKKVVLDGEEARDFMMTLFANKKAYG